MNFEIIRDLILISGWPILIISSIFMSIKLFSFCMSENNVVLKRLIFILVIGLLVSMYGLAVVATVFMINSVVLGVLVVLPVFIVWIPSIFIVLLSIYRL